MSTGGRRLAWVFGVIGVCAVVVVSVAAVVAWRMTRDDDGGAALTDPFPTPALRRAAAPFQPRLGDCKIERLGYGATRNTTTTCEPGSDGPPVTFTEYRSPTDAGPGAALSLQVISGPRNGGQLVAGDEGIFWRDHEKHVSISVEAPSDWDVHRLMQWWDTTTAGAGLATGGVSASPTAAAAVEPPATVAGLPYLVRDFARSYWADIKSCSKDIRGTYSSFYPTLYLGVMLDEMYECELSAAAQKAGGFDKIMFVTWEGHHYRKMEHEAIGKVYGAERLADQPGLTGPKSGKFLAYQPAGHCVVYWDDEAVAVAAWSLPSCKKGGKTTPDTLKAFWTAR
jgi:hypothetical protein